VTRQDEEGNQYQKSVHSSTLVPGDIIDVRADIRMPCDVVLLSGSVIVNESVLTGESVPVIKNELPHSNVDIYDPIADQKYTIYGGTEVLKSKSYWNNKVIALMILLKENLSRTFCFQSLTSTSLRTKQSTLFLLDSQYQSYCGESS